MTAPLRFPNAAPGAPEGSHRKGRAFTRFFEDELGSRSVASDDGGATIEVLQINRAFADSPDFERALRSRVEEVRGLHHASLAAIQSVEQIDGLGLCLVSAHTPGRRLSELASADCGPALAMSMIRAITPALAVMHQSGRGLAHGTVSAEQIVLGSDGHLTAVEHVFGPAIESLRLSRRRLNDSGLVVLSGDFVGFDTRSDMAQLGFLALSLFLQRPLDAADFPAGIPALLDEFVRHSGSPLMASPMRVWLERAMQIGPRPFASATQALEEFNQFPNDIEVQRAESAVAMLAFPSEASAPPEAAIRLEPPIRPAGIVKPIAPLAPPPRDDEAANRIAAIRATLASSHSPAADASKSAHRGVSQMAAWIVVAVSLIAIGEAAAIFWLAQNRSATDAFDGQSAGPAANLEAAPQPSAPIAAGRASQSSPAGATPVPPRASGAAPRPLEGTPALRSAAPPSPQPGRLTITSAVELQVFSEGSLVGSTGKPIALSPGTHNLELVNDALRFRQTQVARVRNGQTASLNVVVAIGRVSINATPWAEVTIDGTAAGETPIANLPLAIGAHDLVFRHPRLGERRQTIVVKAGVLTLVTQPFQSLDGPRAR